MCQIYAIAFCMTLILSQTYRKIDACRKNLIYDLHTVKLAVDQTKIAISKVIIFLSGFIFSSCFLLDIDNIWKRVIYGVWVLHAFNFLNYCCIRY